jgi:HlyD family secretion protein
MKRKWIWLCALALLALAALLLIARPRAIPVETARVDRGVFTLSVREDGIARVRDRYVVAAPVAGLLMRPALRIGDGVRRGDVVALIVPNAAQMLDARTRAELGARVDAAGAHASRARTLLRQAEAALVQAEDDRRRIGQLAAGGFASQTEQERANVNHELRRKDVEAARFEAAAAEHDLAQARAALRGGDAAAQPGTRNAWSIRAPIDGTVLRLMQESEIALGVGAPIMEIGDLSRLEARVDVLSTDATRIETDALVELDAGGVRLAGRVRRVEPAGYTRISALGIEEQRVDVLVDFLPNPVALARIADGYRVDATIEIAREEQALRVPLSALFRHGDRWAVFRVEGGRARLTPLQVGQRGEEFATVLHGVEAGTEVVVYPSDAVDDGVRVRAPPTGG